MHVMTTFIHPSLRRFSLGLLALVLLGALPACNGSKAFVKRGAKMEEAGMMPQAANLYYTAVVKKPSNIDAMVGLKRTGQVVLGQHIAAFDEAVAYDMRETALDAWHDAEDRASVVEVRAVVDDSERHATDREAVTRWNRHR